MDPIFETPQQKSIAKLIGTALFTGILLFKNSDIKSSVLVEKSAECADEILKLVPEPAK